MLVVIGIGLGGALGALSRYGLDRLIERHADSSFPWSTFAINVSGCFVVGFVIAAFVDRHAAPEWVRAALVIGFCGGYTTFSTFAQETLDLVGTRAIALAVANVGASVALGLLAVLAGSRVGRFT